MVQFRGLSFGMIGRILIMGYIAFLVVVFSAQSFGWIEPKANLGMGFVIIAAGLAMLLVYTVIVKKGLTLSFNDFLTIFLLGAIVIGVLVFLPKLAPSTFQASLVQFQSIVGMG